jgi:hypothetical protein
MILSVIFHTMNSAIFAIMLSHFRLLQCSPVFRLLQCSAVLWFRYTELSHFATLLSHFVILLQLPQSFCNLVSNFLYIELNNFLYSDQQFFDCYSTNPFCDFVILNSTILLQCSAILWFCYNYLSHFVIMSAIFYTLNSTFFPTVLNHFSIAIVLDHFVIFATITSVILWSCQQFFVHWAQPFFLL